MALAARGRPTLHRCDGRSGRGSADQRGQDAGGPDRGSNDAIFGAPGPDRYAAARLLHDMRAEEQILIVPSGRPIRGGRPISFRRDDMRGRVDASAFAARTSTSELQSLLRILY